MTEGGYKANKIWARSLCSIVMMLVVFNLCRLGLNFVYASRNPAYKVVHECCRPSCPSLRATHQSEPIVPEVPEVPSSE